MILQSTLPPLILIVDDDDQMRLLLKDILEHEGYRVETASDGIEGLAAVKRRMPNLVLTDLVMPAMDGSQLIRALRDDASTKHLPIIILSGYGKDTSDIVRGLEQGADDYITKPFAYFELLARIKSRLRMQQLESELQLRTRELMAMKALQRRTEELEGILKAIAAKNIRVQQKTVFISYRRSSGKHLAQLIFQDLESHGYDVFLDVNTLDGGAFDQVILNQIATRAHFILVLTPGCLMRCSDEDDWLRREMSEAIRLKKNIVPVIDEDFQLEQEKIHLPEPLRSELFRNNCLPYTHFQAKNVLTTLRSRFLNRSVQVPQTVTPVEELAEVQARIEQALRLIDQNGANGYG